MNKKRIVTGVTNRMRMAYPHATICTRGDRKAVLVDKA